jgi:sulfur-oxidizing protein SoxX
MNRNLKVVAVALSSLAIGAGCATVASDAEISQRALAVMKSGFKANGQAKLDRLDQDDVQSTCSKYQSSDKLPKEVAQKLEEGQLKLIRYPSDGQYLGDWKAGEAIAQSGVGKQFSDDPSRPAGGNCYACHQLSKQELAFGTIGPSLLNYGKLRGQSDEIKRYTFGKIYNAEAFSACSLMPRFGHNAILTEKQIKDVVALLLDPESPVNK